MEEALEETTCPRGASPKMDLKKEAQTSVASPHVPGQKKGRVKWSNRVKGIHGRPQKIF